MTNKNIKAVCFDFGGVIELYEDGNILENIAELLNVPADDLKKEYFKHNHLCNIGDLSWDDVAIKAASFFDNTKETKNKILSMIRDNQSKRKINTELLDIFPILRKQGLKVAIFSNNSLKLRGILDAKGITKLVDEIVISSEIGLQKPHKEAFQVLFEKLSVNPEEVIFVDDAHKSLEKASEIGYKPILFENNEQLKIELKNLGIIL